MSKIKLTDSILSFDDVLNDINDWLAEENSENDEIGDNLDELEMKKNKLILTQARSTWRKNISLKNLKIM